MPPCYARRSLKAGSWLPIQLTTDHTCYSQEESRRLLSSHPDSIRSATSNGIKRVAGSLAVTRALGDAYLKAKEFSFQSYPRHAGCVLAEPEVATHVVPAGAVCLVLASDGVWEVRKEDWADISPPTGGGISALEIGQASPSPRGERFRRLRARSVGVRGFP